MKSYPEWLKRGQRVQTMADIHNCRNRIMVKKGEKGTLLTDYIDEADHISVQFDRLYYPIHYVLLRSLKPLWP